MKIEEFVLERTQSLYENDVPINMSESGVHAYALKDLLSTAEIADLCEHELGYGWTNGAPELRQTIADLYPGRTKEEVIVTNGSAEANFLMVMAVLNPGDELVLVVPNYLQIPGWARAIGVTVKQVPLTAENGWVPDPAAIEAIITPRTKAISICNPNNPTGSLLTLDQMQSLVDLARKHGLFLHADEIYKGSELDTEEGPSFADLYDRAIITNGLSKAMAMPGLRIGWLVGPAEVIAEAWHRKDYTSITTGTLSEIIGAIVLKPDRRRDVLTRSKHILRENRAILTAWVERNSDYFSYAPPSAGGMGFLRYTMDVGSLELIDKLRIEKGVFPVAGEAFGMDGYIRVGIGHPSEHLIEGLSRIEDFVRTHYPAPTGNGAR